MAYLTIFKRYELKYILTSDQKEKMLKAIEPYMVLDEYGRSTIRNIYFDTGNYRLIRRSTEKPIYKEKLRIRSYKLAKPESTVFVELKKKYKDIVYKRRISLPEHEAMSWICDGVKPSKDTQITHEVDYFCAFYKDLRPSVYLAYDREAFCGKNGGDFRITFDDNIMFRQTDLSLRSQPYGEPIIPCGQVIMEVKCSGGMPLWMSRALSEQRIFKTSFSKYGFAYQNIILPRLNQIDNTEIYSYVR